MNRILICEDDENIVSFLKAELEHEGFGADVAPDGVSAVRLFYSKSYDLVLLDIMMPKMNGLECLREMRKLNATPVIVLTARKEIYDKVAFLNAGADDYVTKPFDTLELIARIKRNIERAAKSQDAEILRLDASGYRAFINGSELMLTRTEFDLLLYLYQNRNIVKTRDEIIGAVFGEFYGESNIVDVNIKNIRSKMQAFTKEALISTVRGKGYVIRK